MTNNVDPTLQRAMNASLKAYANGDVRFFDFLREDVRVYPIDAAAPFVGRKAFQSNFGATLKKTKRKVAVISSDIQPSGEKSVLAQTLRITSDGITSFLRQTVIWEKDTSGTWQMSHIHNGLVGQPILTGKVPATLKAVRVLNERIATVAATVGVAQ